MALPYNKHMFEGMGINSAQPDTGKNSMIDTLVKALNSVSGVVGIGVGASSVNVDVDTALHGNRLLATLNGKQSDGTADATATTLLTAGWSATTKGRFTIRVNANATAAIYVSYSVAGSSPV